MIDVSRLREKRAALLEKVKRLLSAGQFDDTAECWAEIDRLERAIKEATR